MIWAQRERQMDSCRAEETGELRCLSWLWGRYDLKAGKHSIWVYTLTSQVNSLMGVGCHSTFSLGTDNCITAILQRKRQKDTQSSIAIVGDTGVRQHWSGFT